jgi:hypothetical protein
MHVRVYLLALVVAGFVPALAQAQSPARVPIPYLTYVAINPLGIPFDIGSVEFETALASGITVGGLGSYADIDEKRYTTFDAKVRYYPGEVVLAGFSVGLSVGRTHVAGPRSFPDLPRPTLDFGTIGILVDYNWLLGQRQRFLVGAGAGAKRVLAGSEARERVDLTRAYPTARFVVGLAF